jgi:exopolysaccharide biosynthesis polyprenyl glycosylphosphotransferase
MFHRFSVNFALLSIAIDALIICLALGTATHMRPYLEFLPFAAKFPEVIPTPWQVYLFFTFVWITINLLFSVYDGRKNIHFIDELTSLTLTSILASVALAGILYLSYREVSRLLFLIFALLSYFSMLTWRLAAQAILRSWKTRLGVQRRVLIVGAGSAGRDLQKQIADISGLGICVLGFLDNNPDSSSCYDDILGPLENATQIIDQYQISDVVIALPQRAYRQMNRLVGELHTLPVKVWVIPDYLHLAMHKAAIDEFAGIPMLDLRAPALTDFQRLVKRAFDLVVSFIMLPLNLFLMVVVALAIRIESPGPVIFRQARTGENGRIFEMLKFRSMIPQADELRHLVEHVDAEGNVIHKQEKDPRVTRVGAVLRRTSLDELPQVINVLKGEMSLVGPRPEIPYLVEKYELWQRQRFAIPQGITGWWQINGRSDKPMHLHTEDDIYYVQNYSLLLDIFILIKTVGVVIRGEGAF